MAGQQRAGHGDGVDGAVEGSVAAAVESVPHGAAAAGLQWAGADEGGVVAAAPGVGEGHDGVGGADRADAAPIGQADAVAASASSSSWRSARNA